MEKPGAVHTMAMEKEQVTKQVTKNFKNVSAELNVKLLKTYPKVLEIFDDIPVEGYDKKYISVFENWPNESQFSEAILNIEPLYDLHRNFNKSLVREFDCKTIRFRGRKKNQIKIKDFCSNESAYSYVSPSKYNINSKFYFNLVIPELEVIYLENSDLTNVVIYRNDALIKPFFDLCKSSDLNILDD